MAKHIHHSDKEVILTTLKKAQAHTGKIIQMVENDDYCIDIIQQLNAVDGYIDSARTRKLSEHLQTCFAEGMTSEDDSRKNELITELIQVLRISQ